MVDDDNDDDMPGLHQPGACAGTAGPSSEEVLLLVHVANGFNKLIRYGMIVVLNSHVFLSIIIPMRLVLSAVVHEWRH